jgi:hypothetical protein
LSKIWSKMWIFKNFAIDSGKGLMLLQLMNVALIEAILSVALLILGKCCISLKITFL